MNSALLDHNRPLFESLRPQHQVERTYTYSDTHIQFLDKEKLWLEMPFPFCYSKDITEIYKCLAMINKLALREEKDPPCWYDGCWNTCTGYQSDHECRGCNELQYDCTCDME